MFKKKHKQFALLTATAIAGLFAFGVKANVVNADSINVDTNTAIRPSAEHVASGGLYALQNGETPNADLLSPLKPRTFTQAPPDPGQLPNGLTEPGGDFVKVAPTAQKVGAKVIIRLPDHYKTFPYGFSTMDDWKQQVDEMVTKAMNSGYKNSIYGYELWNEPNWTYQGQQNRTEEDYFKLWDATYAEVKKLDPNATIVGPSESGWDKVWMDKFFDHVTKAKTMPDVICWHLLGGGPNWTPVGFKQNIKELHEIETKYGISQDTKIVINEYSTREETAVPGKMVDYMQAFENVPQVDGADLAFWYNYGRMDNLLTNQQKPNGGYWLYKWYGDMNGQMDKTSTIDTDGNLASIASTNADKSQTSVIFGGENGDNTVNISGLSQAKFGQKAKVQINETPWYGVDTAVAAPKTVASGVVNVTNGTVQIPVKNMKAADGYQVVVTPADSSAATELSYVQPQASDPIRVEAEDGILTGNAKKYQGSYASGDYYVSKFIDPTSSITLHVNALQDGDYKLEIGYANGNKTTATDKLTLNNKDLPVASFEPTTGWTDSTTNVHGTRRILQYGNLVHLNKGDNIFKITKGDSNVEIDYAQFQLANSGAVTPGGGSSSSSTTTNVPASSSSSASSTSSSTTSSPSSTNTSTSSSLNSSSSSSTVTTPSKPITVSVPKSAAKRGAIIYAVKKINLYKQATFKKSNKVATYPKRTRLNRPLFVVTGYARSENGELRYQVRTAKGEKGYITAKPSYVQNIYYQTAPKSRVVTVSAKKGINSYKNSKLTGEVKHYRKGIHLRVKKLVKYRLTTRYQLSNGHFISGNKLLIIQGKY